MSHGQSLNPHEIVILGLMQKGGKIREGALLFEGKRYKMAERDVKHLHKLKLLTRLKQRWDFDLSPLGQEADVKVT